MLSSKTKRINVYGKRSRRIVEVPPSEEDISATSSTMSKPDRIPMIHRMKKRQNANVKYKPPSPKIVALPKQRITSNTSPRGNKRGMRVAEILAQEARRQSPEPLKVAAKERFNIPSRTPLSTLTLNALQSPSPSHEKPPLKVQKDTSSLKSLVTSKRLSTVEMEIRVIDDNGRTIKQEKRTTRLDVPANNLTSSKRPKARAGSTEIVRKLDGPQRLSRKSRTACIEQETQDTMPRQLEVTHEEPEEPPQPEILSVDSLTSNNSQDGSWDVRPVRRPRRVATRIIVSDDSSSDAEGHGEATYQPSPTPAKSSRRLTAPSAKRNSAFSAPRLKVEVLIPPAPPRLPLTHPSQKETLVKPLKPHSPAAKTRQTIYPTTSYQLAPSPPLKPRPLTPIRRSQTNGLFASPTQPSPTTDSDFDISLEFSQLDLGIPPDELDALSYQHQDFPDYLKPLLEECCQEECGPFEFSAFIDSFPYDPVLRESQEDSCDLEFKKIGEASYSEVFGIGDVVLKVIPLRDETRSTGYEEQDGPAPTDAKDVRKEIIVTRAMGEVHDGFVKLLKTYVVRGKYPEVLLRLWDEYNQRKGSESIRPDTFSVSQVYAIIVLPNDGPDLEAFNFTNPTKTGWRQACSLFWQVAKALGHAEQLVSFEHRDLHWGQILVKDIPTPKPTPFRNVDWNQRTSSTKPPRIFMDEAVYGVKATIIDLGLSRMDAGDGQDGDRVHWTPFDEEVFMGEGDYQFDIYRLMRAHTSNNWENYHPLTNVMWLHYLAVKLLRYKNLKAPPAPRKQRLPISMQEVQPAPSNSGSFSERECYNCLVEIEDRLDRCISEYVPSSLLKSFKPSDGRTKARGRPRKTNFPTQVKAITTPDIGPACALEVITYGVKKGWVRPAPIS